MNTFEKDIRFIGELHKNTLFVLIKFVAMFIECWLPWCIEITEPLNCLFFKEICAEI